MNQNPDTSPLANRSPNNEIVPPASALLPAAFTTLISSGCFTPAKADAPAGFLFVTAYGNTGSQK